ncbi:hypothetical protein BTM25_29610 [Actinomadura rubteroloni]|uniref:Uncharacterized protein n=1 Tax=Actinomadura rubteroloni TaxID=1926885 RepID=A0A2P4UGY3_9ACTN|nr:hypothetical protein [Actinomadura rubteroloni]POM24332.1 hypothetical protein BTM25_29610 [Actinomadura rubteroloni]
MTTDRDDELGEILRRALQAEAEGVEPSGDGLERVRERVAERRLRRFGVPWLAGGWVRPAIAVAAAVAVAGFGVTAAPQTIGFIQAGMSGPAKHGGNAVRDGVVPGQVPGSPGTSLQPSDGQPALGTPSFTGPPTTASSTGAPTCPPVPPPSPTVDPAKKTRAEKTAQPRRHEPCPTPTPAAPTTPPTTPPVTQTTPPPATQSPTTAPTEPASSNNDGSGGAPGAP